MDVGLLGSGDEILEAGLSLLEAGHTITHVGPVLPDARNDPLQAFIKKGAKGIMDHHDLLNNHVRHIVMCSYAPLIVKEDLLKASFYNIHFALLPRFRGYHGFVWSIINDDDEVGYTLHLVDEGIDSGPVFHQGRIRVTDSDDILTLREKISRLIRQETGMVFTSIENGKKPAPQDSSLATYVTRRTPEEGELDWNWSARRIFNLVRAVKPPYTPGAFTYYNGEKLIIHRTHCLKNPPYFSTTGKVVGFEQDAILVKCGDTVLSIDEVEYDGRVLPPRKVISRAGIKLGK